MPLVDLVPGPGRRAIHRALPVSRAQLTTSVRLDHQPAIQVWHIVEEHGLLVGVRVEPERDCRAGQELDRGRLQGVPGYPASEVHHVAYSHAVPVRYRQLVARPVLRAA